MKASLWFGLALMLISALILEGCPGKSSRRGYGGSHDASGYSRSN